MMYDEDIKQEKPKWLEYKGLQLTEEDILRAMANSTSNKKAAQYLDVSYMSYRKYASSYRDGETGKTLFEIHKNQAMKGQIGRTWVNGRKKRLNWDNILRENQRCTSDRINKLKTAIIENDKLEKKCYRCNYQEKRLEDEKIPLVFNFKSGDKSDWRIQNLEFVCYNCAFINCLDFFKDDVVSRIENLPVSSHLSKQDRKSFYQLDDFYLDHIHQIGLEEPSTKPEVKKEKTISGWEFVDRV